MENEMLKSIILETGLSLAPIFATPHELAPFVSVQSHYDRKGFSIHRKWQDSESEMEVCRLRIETPANNGEWWIAAKLLDIPTEMPIDEFELSTSIRQHYHELREAFDAGYKCPIDVDAGWEAYIGDYGKKEMSVPVPILEEIEERNRPIDIFVLSAQNQHFDLLKDAAHISGIPIEMTPIFDSQLREICVALGWQGGTYHGVLEEIKRLKTFEANAKDPRQGDHC